ncbi:cytochrome c [Loktanella fryxellensis]|uniref:Cytochrome c n=1 Tax=Loktanella fryxellensis TaxID=245187 RepID=A0A1H8AVQ1_9RHOB|nr:cytochrome c family protein [Loktanella fryxellensis]SEM74800.1 cytochrome c [Loktanella fryxellensis]
MFDTMTLTKVIGGFCGAFLVFMLGGWAAEAILHPGGHGEGEQAYIIEVPEAGGEAAPAEEAVPYDVALAAADATAGEGVFRNCRSCHALDGADGVGPHLNGVVGRPVQAVDGFGYSGALIEVADAWTEENLYNFLEDPQGWAPGTSMGYAGLSDPADRANLIAYLATTGG